MSKLTPREEADMMALAFLAKGPDAIGVIDSEEKIAAAVVFADLERKGLAVRYFEPGTVGPIYAITPAGRKALEGQADGE